jgi:hypothetical protein
MSSFQKLKQQSSSNYLEKREQGFTMTNLQSVKMKEYNALFDPNMKHFFENKQNQYLLYKTGQIDSHGRVIDLEKNQSKLYILEREFKEAEKVEESRQKEELEMRVRFLRVSEMKIITSTFMLSIAFKGSALMSWRRARKWRYWTS